MGRAALRLIRADLRARPAQALLTGLVIALAAGTLLATLHVRGTFDAPWEDLVRATAGPDVVVDGAPAAVARVAALPEVAQADAVRPVVETAARLRGGPAERLTVTGLPRRPSLDRPLIVAGRALRGPGELLLDPVVADGRGIAPGTDVELGDGARRTTLRVVGIATLGRFAGGAWAGAEDVRALAPAGGVRVASVPLRLRDPAAGDAFAGSAPARARAGSVRIGRAAVWRTDFTETAERRVTILATATLLALLGTAFTLATAVGGRVIAQRRQVALLRAVGLTPVQGTLLLVGFYAALAAVAAPPGLALGALLAPSLLEGGPLIGTAPPGGPGGGLMLAAFAATLLVVVAATALPAARAARRSPVEGLALGRDVTTARASRLAAVARRLRLPVVIGLGIKDAFAQRARSLLTLGSLGLAAVFVVCALGFEATMDRLAEDSSLRARPWDISLSPAGMTPAEMERLIAGAGGSAVAAVGRVDEIGLIAPAAAVEVRGRVMDGPLEPFRYAVPDGRGVERRGEVTAGRGLLEALGARVGDRVALTVRGIPFSARIVGRHVEPDNDGRAVVMTRATLPPAAQPQFDEPAWVLRLRPGADEVAVAAALARAGAGRVGVNRPAESLAREAAELRPIVYGVTGMVVAIGLVNLLTTLLLGLRERERDLAVLGTIGATPRQVAGSVLAGSAALAVPGALLGVPAGIWMLGFLVARTDPSDGPDVIAVPSPLLLALALPAALLVTAAVSALAARQAAAVDPAGALRAE